MMQATPHLPSLPLMVTSLPGLPRFLANPQLPTRASLFPVGRGHLPFPSTSQHADRLSPMGRGRRVARCLL